MGSVLDSTVVMGADRSKLNTQQLMSGITQRIGEQPVVLSAIGYTEILKGLYFDRDQARRRRRELFFNELLRAVPILPYTTEVADIAGRIGGNNSPPDSPSRLRTCSSAQLPCN